MPSKLAAGAPLSRRRTDCADPALVEVGRAGAGPGRGQVRGFVSVEEAGVLISLAKVRDRAWAEGCDGSNGSNGR